MKSSFLIKSLSAHWFAPKKHFYLTNVGASKSSRFFLPLSKSSRHKSRSNCDAARCSDGNKLGLHVISSRKAIVCERSPSSCSKSWKCFDTQCLQKFWFKRKVLRRQTELQTSRHWEPSLLLESSPPTPFCSWPLQPLVVHLLDLTKPTLLKLIKWESVQWLNWLNIFDYTRRNFPRFFCNQWTEKALTIHLKC